MPDDNIDYRIMYPDRNWKSRKPARERTVKPKKEIDFGFFKLTPDTPTPLNQNTLEYRVKDLLFADPNLSVEDIMERLATKPSSKLSITLLRDNYLHTVNFLIRRGATGVRGRDRRRSTRG